MSYDLNFWKYKKGASRDHAALYEAACDGETVEEQESLPIRDIFGCPLYDPQIAERFDAWTDC